MGTRSQAYELGHLLLKIAYEDTFAQSADSPVSSGALADVLEPRAEGLADRLGLTIDVSSIRNSEASLQWKTRLNSYLGAIHGDSVASAFELGVWIPLYASVQGGYPLTGSPIQAQKAAQLAESLSARAIANGLDVSTVTSLIDAARTVGVAGSDPSEVSRVGAEVAVRVAEIIEAQETDASGDPVQASATSAISTTFYTYNLGDGPVINGDRAQVAYRNQSVTQTQTPETSSATMGVAESVANVLRLLPYSGLSADDQEDVQATGSELLAEIDRPEQDPKKIKRALMTLKGYFAPIALNIASGAAKGAGSGAEHAALTAIESMLNAQL